MTKTNNVIKEFRLSRGLSVRAWAKMIRVSPGTVGDWESGRRQLNPVKFGRMKKLLTQDECEAFFKSVAEQERARFEK